jgi:protein-S-isoprenylcysteine O-methyltransferase Ste14
MSVHDFPPLIYLTAFGAGVLIHRMVPMQALPPTAARTAGWLLLLGSLALMAWTKLTLRKAGTTWVPNRLATSFTAAGPYRLTRNPMCMSLAGFYLAAAFMLNGMAPLLLFLPAFVVYDRVIIRREESILSGRFGASYANYQARVRRWI